MDTSPYLQCLFLARFDSSGTPIDSRLICDSLGGDLTMDINWSEIVSTSEGGYAITAASFNRNDGIFIKLKSDLSIEFIQEYPDSVNFVEFYNSIIELSDGYLLGGHLQRPNYLQDAFLRKVGKSGNSIWFSYYGQYDVFDALSSYQKLNDSIAIYVGGYVLNQNTIEGRGPWVVWINTEEGNILKEWRPANSNLEWLHYIYPVSSDKWLLYGKKAFQLNPTRVKPFWALIDTSLNILDTRLFGPGVKISNFFWDIEKGIDGDFIAVGQVNAANPNTEPAQVYGWLYKVSPQLDSLWSLQIIAATDGLKSTGNYLGGVGILSSGNMIAGGYSHANGDLYPWLVKFTPDGCIDTLWCATTSAWEPELLDWNQASGMRLYPNPATGNEVFVQLPAGVAPEFVELFDAGGRLARRLPLKSEGVADISGLAAGYYFCRVGDKSGHVFHASLLIMHKR